MDESSNKITVESSIEKIINTNNLEILAVKCADRAHNLETCKIKTIEKQEKLKSETIRIFVSQALNNPHVTSDIVEFLKISFGIELGDSRENVKPWQVTSKQLDVQECLNEIFSDFETKLA